jgi:hypothetical protein
VNHIDGISVADAFPNEIALMQPEIMYIEDKAGGIRGDGRICLVRKSKTGRTLYYGDLVLKSLEGSGYKANHFDEETGDEYWVSRPKRDGTDSLYAETITVDDDVRETYWTEIRSQPDEITVTQFRSPGKYGRKRPS